MSDEWPDTSRREERDRAIEISVKLMPLSLVAALAVTYAILFSVVTPDRLARIFPVAAVATAFVAATATVALLTYRVVR